nr:hypothetical protein [Desulfosarcinaceae bacterium]
LASGERREVEIFCGPIRVKGEILLSAIVHDVSDRLQIEKEREALIQELQRALKEIKSLQGIIPICSSCKNIRNDAGAWSQLEEYLSEHSDAEFSHGLCPQCAKTLYPDVDL